MIDNYDSFTYNVVHAFHRLGQQLQVHFNDKITLDECLSLNPKAIVIGPGPGAPAQAGICLDLIHASAKNGIPLLGICLGMQAIGEAFGGQVVRALKPMHGKLSSISHEGIGAFRDIPQNFQVTRYHSLIVNAETLPKTLQITAKTDEGEIMALRHTSLPIEGVQFHPEAVATENGLQLLQNWLKEKLL